MKLYELKSNIIYQDNEKDFHYINNEIIYYKSERSETWTESNLAYFCLNDLSYEPYTGEVTLPGYLINTTPNSKYEDNPFWNLKPDVIYTDGTHDIVINDKLISKSFQKKFPACQGLLITKDGDSYWHPMRWDFNQILKLELIESDKVIDKLFRYAMGF
jgi:hypothetical protein